MDEHELVDISPLLSRLIAVFPGDTMYSREVLMDHARGDNITLSTLRTTVHVGAHADAPSHYRANASTIDEQPIDLYVGPCDLIDLDRPKAVGTDGWRAGLDQLRGEVKSPRVLLRTNSFQNPNEWSADFLALDPALIDHLADRGVRLIGVDTPSVDPSTSKTLPTHARCFERGVSIIEGLTLTGVRATAQGGCWELIALPLKLQGCDGSPVRAVLRARFDDRPR
ncbi:MAG: cyclase family protein [Planctomycetota bacterium]|nr:cyclase family protein [Planctomycetota bacterium]